MKKISLWVLAAALVLVAIAPLSHVAAVNGPDFTVTKTNNLSGNATVSLPFNWILTLTNNSTSTATFPNGNRVVLRDQLPTSGATYGTPTSTRSAGVTGTLSCSIASSVLSCTAGNGANALSIPGGGTMTVSFAVTPTANGSLSNPRAAGICAVDPDAQVVESNEGNNACNSNVVTVGPAPVLTGSLVVTKTTVGGDGLFNFTGGLGNFQITTVSGTGTNALTGLAPGSYGISESASDDWDLTGNTCASITVTAGSTSTCTFTNTKKGTLVVRKVVVNDQGGIAATSSFGFSVDGGGIVAFGEDGQEEIIVAAGIHNVTEPDHEGYTPSYNNCSSVTVPAGGSATCTITNDDEPGRLIIAKTAVGGNDTFDFTVNGGSLDLEESIETNGGIGSTDPIEIDANTDYTIDEVSLPTDWDFTDVDCQYEGESIGVEGPEPTAHIVNVASGETVTCTYTNTKRASLTITKVSDPAEGEFQFDLEGPGPEDIPATHTFRPSGEWNLAGLLPGDYNLSETILSPDGWDGSQDIACTGGENPTGSVGGGGFDFTLNPGDAMSCLVNNTQDAAISGKKFEDMDGVGSGVSGAGLEGWEITFEFQGDEPFTETAFTDEDGNYTKILQPGTYRVCEEAQEGWYQSYPDDTTQNVASCESGRGYSLTVIAGSTTGGVSFGNYHTGTIAGTKWHDEDGDGLLDLDPEEPGIAGWDIQLLRGTSVLGTQTTDGDGEFLFTDIAPGEYTLREVMQEGWAQTFPGGNGELPVVMTSNGVITDKNFGNVDDATISGMKWNDQNADGIKGEDESGLEGWTIYADLNDDGSYDDGEPYTVTEEDGTYQIAGLLPGTYILREVSQPKWVQIFPASGSHSVTVGIDDEVTDKNFGNAPAIPVSGLKWDDENADGERGGDESGIAGWTITASPVTQDGEVDTESGRAQKEIVTGSDGSYEFDFLQAETGLWRIAEQQQVGWSQTYPTLPSYYDVLVAEEGVYEGNDFGNWQSPIVEVRKWSDLDGNSTQNGVGEDPVSLWPMALGRVIGEASSTVQVEIIDIALTDENGVAELFTSPVPGNYVVLEGTRDSWVTTYPAPRTENLSVTFAAGVEPVALVTNSFFNVPLELSMNGDVIDEGSIPSQDGEGGTQKVTLEFGNHEVISIHHGGGGDGDGGSGSPDGQVLGESTTTVPTSSTTTPSTTGNTLGEACKLPLTAYLRRDRANDLQNVKDLQNFLNAELGLTPPLPLTGFFGPLTESGVKAFQMKYYDEILKPWVDLGLLPANSPTGIVYKTTLWKVQMLGCPGLDIPKPSLP